MHGEREVKTEDDDHNSLIRDVLRAFPRPWEPEDHIIHVRSMERAYVFGNLYLYYL